MDIHLPQKVFRLRGLRLSVDDVEKIFKRLLAHVKAEAEIALQSLSKQPDETDDQFQARKEEIRTNVFRVTITVSGDQGSSLFGDAETIFTSPNRPNRVDSIFMTNVTAFESRTGNRPPNSFEFLLDFSRPALLDSRNFVSSPTPNNSHLTVQGNREAWVAAVSDAVMGILNHRRIPRNWLHRGFVYDFGMMALAIPAGFYACWKASPMINEYIGAMHPFVAAAAYLYVFLLVLWVYRILFGYSKWAFPAVELKDNPDSAVTHRAVWAAIVLGLVANAIWEVGKLA